MSRGHGDLRERAYLLFLEVLEQAAEGRPSFLQERCAGDLELQAEVESLLASHTDAEGFLGESLLPVGAGHPQTIGPYRVLELLGEGGMGMVYLAEQEEPIHRMAAIKVIKLGMDTRRVQERFQLERQALARMSHPAIARILEVGTTSRGQAYFAMEYVDGEPITTYCEREDLPLERRLELLQEVCRAVQHAHQKGILHRDIKPSNVLVTTEDGRPRPHVIDFGVARALDEEGERTANEAYAPIGTPDYMSPEQAGVGQGDVDSRTDVYSLGVLLYEVVSGERPYRFGKAQALLQAQQRLGPDAPRPPRPMRQGQPLPQELEWIILTAIEHDRRRRYGTPNELADDLQRFLRREPVLVGPPSKTYLLRKFVQRNRAVVTVGLLLFLSLTIGFGTFLWMWNRSEQANREIEGMLANYRSVADDLTLQGLEEEADWLWPAWPQRSGDFDDWLARAQELLERIPVHQLELKRSASFPAEDRVWLEGRRSRLLSSLERLEQGAPGEVSIPRLRRRLAFAQALGEASLVEASAAWEEAIAAIAVEPLYRGLQLEPQVGLVPLGPDPTSGLWEFLVWGTGVAPQRGEDGRWKMTEECGVVLVLLPGGEAVIGVDRDDDPAAYYIEGPRHLRELQPFFLSKYELSRSQAERMEEHFQVPLKDRLGSEFDLQQDGRLPLTDVHWVESRDLLATLGLEFPTAIQWEYGARAGETRPWLDEFERLHLYGNLRDLSAAENAKLHGETHEAIDDGFAYASPIGSFLPNRFGIHDVHGNVYEWCRGTVELFDDMKESDLGGSLLEPRQVDDMREVRGGSYQTMAFGVRFTLRVRQYALIRSPYTGIRPARRISPAEDFWDS